MEIPGNLGDIMQQAQQMQQKFSEVQQEVEKREIEASSGGGMVTVVMNGAQRLTSIKIDPTVVNTDDIEMLQDLVLAAVNEGSKKSKEMLKEELSKLTGGIPIPGFS